MRSLVHRLLLSFALGSGISLSGCYALIDECNDTEQCFVNEYRAHAAWYRMDDCYDEVEHRCDFASGFRDGYRAAAERGDHCLPLMPPRKYWKHCYQNCEGRQKIDAWYEGYAHGMLAALQDGADVNQRIPVYGVQPGMARNHAAYTVTLEESTESGNLPEPAPMGELPVDHTREPNAAPPVTGHSVPGPVLPDGESGNRISPRFQPRYPDQSQPGTIKPLGDPAIPPLP